MRGFGEKFSKVVSNTKKQAQALVEVNKLKVAIGKEEDEINAIISRIGQRYVEDHREDAGIPPHYRGMLDDILAREANMRTMKAEIDELQGNKTCPDCAQSVEIDKQFCGNCGHRFDMSAAASDEGAAQSADAADDSPPAQEQAGAPSFCSACGNPLSEGTRFCGKCGQKVE
jgi:predicted nucleic acid-binding Zn ribbon protein